MHPGGALLPALLSLRSGQAAHHQSAGQDPRRQTRPGPHSETRLFRPGQAPPPASLAISSPPPPGSADRQMCNPPPPPPPPSSHRLHADRLFAVRRASVQSVCRPAVVTRPRISTSPVLQRASSRKLPLHFLVEDERRSNTTRR